MIARWVVRYAPVLSQRIRAEMRRPNPVLAGERNMSSGSWTMALFYMGLSIRPGKRLSDGQQKRVIGAGAIERRLTEQLVCQIRNARYSGLAGALSSDFVRTEGQDYEAGDEDRLGKGLGLGGFEQVGQGERFGNELAALLS
jgi:hypothetical protein